MRKSTAQRFPILRRIQDVPIPKKRNIKRIYVHHAYSWWGGDAEEVDRWHRDRGFRTIGYNTIVNFGESINNIRPETGFPAGIIQIGRNVNSIPAGVLSDNRRTIHICVMGLFDKYDKDGNPGTVPDGSQPRETAVGLLAATYCKKLNLPVRQVLGHREAKFVPGIRDPGKSCPGDLIECDLMRAFIWEILHYRYDRLCKWYENLATEFLVANPEHDVYKPKI